MPPAARFWIADTHGARGLGDIRGSGLESEWFRAATLKDNTPNYDVAQFTINIDPQQFGALRRDHNSGWRIKGDIQAGRMVTLEASREGAILHMYEGITIAELKIRSDEFKRALGDAVKTESKKSNMVLPPSPGIFSRLFPGPDSKRMKMQVVVTQALYAEKQELFTADCKGATISVDLAQIAAESVAPGSMSAIAIANPTLTLSFSAQTKDVARTVSPQEGKNLVAYALQPLVCTRKGECWELEGIERTFVKPPRLQVSPLDSIWS